MASSAQLKAQAKYDKQNTKQLMLKLNTTNDADILAKLDAIENKQGYIKKLVRDNLKNTESVLTVESIKFLLLLAFGIQKNNYLNLLSNLHNFDCFYNNL